VIFVILISLRRFSKNRGFLSGFFLTLYGSFRLLVENFRQPDEQIGLFFDKITMGQALSLPLVFFGIAIVFLSLKKNKY
jgi:phosphatidylglycerol:prolipoprotein diacylglycerol transferase